jgi:predicted nucleotidyltransferase
MVILFGSHARGEATPDSDVDLLVVMDAVENPLRMAANISASVAHPFPLDILVIRSDQLEASAGRNGVFATEILTQGRVLYEAGD